MKVLFIKPKYCKNMKYLRKLNNFTQADVALILSIRQEQYSKYETGARDLPLGILVKLCVLYHVSSDYLIGLKID